MFYIASLVFIENIISYEDLEMSSYSKRKSTMKEILPRISEVKSCFNKPDFLSIPSVEMQVIDLPISYDFHANLPAATDEELMLIDWKLKGDKSYREKLTRYLYKAGGEGSILSFMTKMLKALFVRDVAIQYSMYGKKGKKPFVNLMDICAIIFGVASVKFPLMSQNDISERLSRALALVCDWSQGLTKAVVPVSHIRRAPQIE
ncbi:uncharacterized protein LOC129972677 [Argiope bruennichi]|uniref:uncharacterized protein LOC129972677 n=1 Tax=Argiope bruennichi TaxID=94029 RepID=UPI002494FC29|nr:uncharacterized protein LOC129972677 [Argiope bruennichi]